MKYYKNSDGVVFAYESDGSQDEFIDPALIPITEEEAMAIANPPKTKEDHIADAEIERARLLEEANSVTEELRVELMLGIISESDKEILTKWVLYTKSIKSLDVSTAPDVTWPTPPSR